MGRLFSRARIRATSRARIPATQCESERGTADAMGERSSDEPLPAAIQDAVAAAIDDGASMDEIVARVRAGDGESSVLIPRARRCARARPDEGRWAERMDGLICLQRETDRFAEEWVRTREPGAEGRSALIAIETLRTLALRTMADLSQRTEPVPTEDLARLALALYRIESADKLRIEREQAAAAAAHAGPAARAANMTHAERVETVRRALEGHLFPGGTDPPPAAFGWAAASPADTHVTPLDLASDSPAGDGAQDAQDAAGAQDVRDARTAEDCVGPAHSAGCRPETARGGRPTLADRPSLLPCGVERARVRRGAPPPLRPGRRAPGSSCGPDVLGRNCRAMRRSFCSARIRATQCKSERAAAGATGVLAGSYSARTTLSGAPATFQARATRACATQARATLSRGIPLIPLNPTESRLKIEFCPRWDGEPDRDRGETCGLGGRARADALQRLSSRLPDAR